MLIFPSIMLLLVHFPFKLITFNKRCCLSTLKCTTKSIGGDSKIKINELHPSLDKFDSDGFKGNPNPISYHILINKEKHAGLTLNQVIENESFLNTSYLHKLIKFGAIYTSSTRDIISTSDSNNDNNNKLPPRFTRLLDKSELEQIINDDTSIVRLRMHVNPLRKPHAWNIDWKDTILHETDDYVAINKPPAIATVESVDNLYENSKYQILNLMRTRKKNGTKTKSIDHSNNDEEINIYPAGRLDIPTSGVVVYPKTSSFANEIFKSMKDGKVIKEYHALTNTQVPVGMIKHAYKKHSKSNRPVHNPTLLRKYDQKLLEIEDDLHLEIERIAMVDFHNNDVGEDINKLVNMNKLNTNIGLYDADKTDKNMEKGMKERERDGTDRLNALIKRNQEFMLVLKELEKRQVKAWKKALKEWHRNNSNNNNGNNSSSNNNSNSGNNSNSNSNEKEDEKQEDEEYPSRSQWKLAALQILSCTPCSSSSNDTNRGIDGNGSIGNTKIKEDWQWKWQDHHPLDDKKDYSRYEDYRRPLYESHIQLLTGKTHQIRLQLAALNAAIIGDVQYIPVEGMFDTSIATTTITNNYHKNGSDDSSSSSSNGNNNSSNSSKSSSRTKKHGDGTDIFGLKPDHIGLHCSSFKIPHLGIDVTCTPPWRERLE